MSTIFALASGRGRAGVAVIRISGLLSHHIVVMMCGDLPPLRTAALRKLIWDTEILDEALILVFAQGASFTGEQSAELHVHGGQAVIEAIFSVLRSFPDVRLAEPGEFTRRALENGNLELYQVEGLVDLIDAETAAQHKQAQRMLQGQLAVRVQEWRSALLGITALVEVTIDFADEDVPSDIWPEVLRRLSDLCNSLAADLNGAKAAERIRTGFEVAIFGPPNVGKSSLVNALVCRDVAITSEIAGTTRDIIEVRLDLEGLPVTLLDTAGLRESDDRVEQEGVRRARQRVDDADMRIVVLDRDHAAWDPGFEPDFIVSSKADLGWVLDGAIPVSTKANTGVDVLRQRISEKLHQIAGVAGVVVNERHRAGVASSLLSLREAILAIDGGQDAELIASQLRDARRFLEALVGRIGVEDVLSEIFGRFCIGK